MTSGLIHAADTVAGQRHPLDLGKRRLVSFTTAI
jgi:hypothetical protein